MNQQDRRPSVSGGGETAPVTDDKATPADEPFSMLINAIERDLERTPEGRGGEIRYTPETPRHGGMGQNGDYLLREWREVTAALAAERDRADRAEATIKKAISLCRNKGTRDPLPPNLWNALKPYDKAAA